MCEHCQIGRVSGEPLPEGSDPDRCAYIVEEGEIECPVKASYIVSEYSCDTHLCEEHMQDMNTHLDEGLGDLLRFAGLQQATDFLPIKGPSTCEHLAIEEMIGTSEDGSCQKPAAYAQMIWERTAACTQHAKMMGYSPEAEAE